MLYQNFSQSIKQHFHLSNHGKRAIIDPILLTALISLLLVSAYELFKYVDIWNSWMIAGGNSLHFCEMNKEGMAIKQTSNTWSNLGYLLVGFILFSIGYKDHKNKARSKEKNFLAMFPGFTILLAVGMVWLFVGSFFYHASLSLSFQKMDVTGIYAIVLALFTYNIFKAFPTIKFKGRYISSHYLFLGIGIALNVLFFIEIYKWNINIVFPVLIVLLFILNVYNGRKIKSKQHFKYMIWSSLTMIVAATLWILDRTDVLCSPTSVFQGHALWHLLTALAVFLLYFFYRTEELKEEKTL